ncbi:MAG: OmpA family protein, partial [Treponema sp.]|nr:OmpA family protein [Treponema sp.]
MKVKRSILFLPILFVSSFLSAQTAAEVESVLSAQAVTLTQASRFVLAVADVLDETAEPGAAYALAREQGWLPQNVSPDSSIGLGELCFLIMKAFDMKGSLLYAAFPGPRYAFRELNYLKLIPGQKDPGVKVSGEWFLQILGTVAAYTGVDQKPPEEAPAPLPVIAAEEPVPPPAVGGLGAVKLDNIYFGSNSAILTETEKAKLRNMAAVLSQYPNGKVLIGGHTAITGNENGRRQISRERAQAVADFLISQTGRLRESIIVHGYGARRPLSTARGNA